VTGNGDYADLFVEGPYFVPLHGDDRARASLGYDELLQTLNCHTSTQHSTHCGEPGVVPTLHTQCKN